MTAYKVTSQDLKSAVRGPVFGETQYIFNEWVFPLLKHGPLCTFKNKKRAVKFARLDFVTGKVFKCKIKKSKEQYFVWNKYETININDLLAGTILADAVKLIKEIKL